MSDQLNDALRRQANKNEPIDLSLFEVAMRFLYTSKGWWMRQILKLLTAPLAAAAAWLQANGVSGDKTDAIILGLTAAATGLLEIALSHLQAKYARKAQPIE